VISIFEPAPAAAGWPRYQHIIFDCDSTLSAIEGIDVLASRPDTQARVVDLTNAAMNGSVPLDSVYGERLEMISPTRQSVRELATTYMEHAVADARETVSLLRQTGCDVYIVSGGLLEPVKEFGIALNIEAENIRAVELEYDQLGGEWWRSEVSTDSQEYLTYRQGALVESNGKESIILGLLKNRRGASLLIGDGVSDLLARNAVDLFIGYGGVVKRARVQQEAPVFLTHPSLLPVLPLALGSRDFFRLDSTIRNRVLACLTGCPPLFNRKVLERNFFASFIHSRS